MTRLISPLARVTIGTDVFVSGDGILKSVSVELSEDKRSSRCQFQLYDKGLLWGAKYQAISFASGGIVTPSNLFKEEEAPAVSPSSTPSNDPSGTTTLGASTQNGTLSNEVRAFLDLIAWSEGSDYNILFGGGKFSSYADHPNRRIKAGGYTSSAAGRYQILDKTWFGEKGKPGVKQSLGLKDFSPASQDLAAVWLIDKKRKALKYVEQGTKGLKQALDILSYEWASFPPARYPQPTKSFADLTNKYISFLLKYQRQNPSQTAATTQPAVKDKAATSGTLQDKAATKPAEVKDKGCKIVVELGYSLDQMVAYDFFHVGTTTSSEALDTTVFVGQTIRWVMSRRKYNTAYTNITLRQLAQIVCSRYGLKLDMEGNGPTYQHLDQTGITDYSLLLRECRAIGYSIREEKNVLILKPYRPNFTGFMITRDILQSIRFTDRASADHSPTPSTTVSDPAAPAAETKTKHDRKTGQVAQIRTEDSTGTGAKNSKPAGVTGAATGAVHGTIILDSSVTGLPKQEIGSIDLADGKATAADLSDEAKRVKGYESSCSLVTTPELLTLAPGSIIAVSDDCAPDPFCREWRVSSVRHSLEAGRFRSELSFYSPQAQKDSTASTSNDTATSSTASTPTSGQNSFIVPCSGTTGDGIGAGRNHKGIDIANAAGTPIVASAEGVVYSTLTSCRIGDLECGGGFGNYIAIKHVGGYYTRYAHLQDVLVSPGQQVKQGTKIATMGTTGRSYPVGRGWHLHFEIRQGDSFGRVIAPSEVGCKIPSPPNKRSNSRY